MKVWEYGNNINTDMLFPGRYTYTCARAEEIMPHLLEDLDAGFASSVRPGDIIMAGRNFGCGSSREQPAIGLNFAGIQAIIAKSFARIFFRAAINQGLILIECPEAVDAYREKERIEIHLKEGRMSVAGRNYAFPAPPDAMLAIRDAGGLLPYVRQKLAAERA